MSKNLLIWMGHATKDDVHLIGEYAVRLSEMSQAGIPFSSGFIITTDAYALFSTTNNLPLKLSHIESSASSLKAAANNMRVIFEKSDFPEILIKEILDAYTKLVGSLTHTPITVSLVGKDTEDKTTVKGEANLFQAIKNMWGKMNKKGDKPFAILVQKEHEAKITGTMVTTDPDDIAKQTRTITIGEITYKIEKKADKVPEAILGQLPFPEKDFLGLSELAERIEGYTYFPQKVLWTYDNGKFTITDVRQLVPSTIQKTNTPQNTEHIGKPTATKVYVSLDSIENVSEVAKKHVDGVGLLSFDHLMKDSTNHPKDIIKNGKEKDFINTLANRISTVCSAFSPRPVIYRTSDFYANDYAAMQNGRQYEPVEKNPLLGLRGALRYIQHADVFELELMAIKKVRNALQLKNLWLMLPFIRTKNELLEMKSLLAANGLYRSPSFKLWMSVETPANVVSLDSYIETGIDGVVIEPVDLVSLFTGIDMTNPELTNRRLEEDPAIMWAYGHILHAAHKHGILSLYIANASGISLPVLERLVEHGISSISVMPSESDLVREQVIEKEKELLSKK